jgi:hypothetical protein
VRDGCQTLASPEKWKIKNSAGFWPANDIDPTGRKKFVGLPYRGIILFLRAGGTSVELRVTTG